MSARYEEAEKPPQSQSEGRLAELTSRMRELGCNGPQPWRSDPVELSDLFSVEVAGESPPKRALAWMHVHSIRHGRWKANAVDKKLREPQIARLFTDQFPHRQGDDFPSFATLVNDLAVRYRQIPLLKPRTKTGGSDDASPYERASAHQAARPTKVSAIRPRMADDRRRCTHCVAALHCFTLQSVASRSSPNATSTASHQRKGFNTVSALTPLNHLQTRQSVQRPTLCGGAQ